MAVSRRTVQQLLKSGRAKLIRTLLESSALLIAQEGDHEAL
jgi:predicted DNA-binding protein (UPF0251 family)